MDRIRTRTTTTRTKTDSLICVAYECDLKSRLPIPFMNVQIERWVWESKPDRQTETESATEFTYSQINIHSYMTTLLTTKTLCEFNYMYPPPCLLSVPSHTFLIYFSLS